MTFEEGDDYAKSNRLSFCEASAMDPEDPNIKQQITKLIEKVCDLQADSQINLTDDQSVKLENKINKPLVARSLCCYK